jgi:hypothetical protein
MQTHHIPNKVRSSKALLTTAREISAGLFYTVISETCPHYPGARTLPIFNRLRGAIGREAWLDAAQLVIDLRLPRWRIQQIYCDDGRWTCVMCLRWYPVERLNAVCIGTHPSFELTILAAYLETIERSAELELPLLNVMPLRPARGSSPIAICSKPR